MAVAVAARPKLEPFTVSHFEQWALRHELDNGENWEVEPYFARFLADVFAGFPICWLVVPEENGKTTNVAGLALYVIEHKQQAYIPVAASARDQAEWIYRQAEGLAYSVGSTLGSERKKRGKFICLEGFRRIRCDEMHSRIQVFAADDRSGDGIIPGGIAILDELHRHKSLALYRTWAGKLRKRGAQLVVISTAGEVGAEFEAERARLRQQATTIEQDGRCFTRGEHWLNDQRLAVIHDYAVPEDGDIDDLELVKEANPFTGVTLESLEQKKAMRSSLPHWSRFTCNRASRSEAAAITEAEWHAQATDDTIPVGEPVGAGLDVAWKIDTTALVPLWMPRSDYRLLGPATILTPPRDGNSLDPAEVEQAILELHARNPIHTLVMDTSRAEQLADWISQTTGAVVVDRPQTNPEAILDYARWMEALREGWLWHSGDPGLTQHVFNAVARVLPGGGIRFDRQGGRRGRDEQLDLRVWDALTAASMIHSFMAGPEESNEPLMAVAFG